MARVRNYSENTAEIIDSEIRRLVDEAYDRAAEILIEKKGVLDVMSDRLLEVETLTREQIRELVEGVETPGGEASGEEDASEEESPGVVKEGEGAGGTEEREEGERERADGGEVDGPGEDQPRGPADTRGNR